MELAYKLVYVPI